MTLAEAKKSARKSAFAARKRAFDARMGDTSGHLRKILGAHRGRPLAGYMPIHSEIDPLPAMEEAAALGPVGVPVIEGKGQPLRFAGWTPGCDMVDGPFGARVPAVLDLFEPEVLIVPLVAFSRDGMRLGYGGGFYDRTLALLRAKRPTLAIGFAFSAQEQDSLPLEATDQPLDLIVTETGVITPQAG